MRRKMPLIIAALFLASMLMVINATSSQACEPSPDDCEIETRALIAGGGGPLAKSAECVGIVEVWTEDCSLYVRYTTTGDWMLGETHLAVETDPDAIPQKNGNPQPGKFDYKKPCPDDNNQVLYEIPLAELGVSCGEPLFIAAHAEVYKVVCISCWCCYCIEETAWGAGCDFSGANWAMYFSYVVCCPTCPTCPA